MSQREFCAYLNQDPSNVGARAKRRGLSPEDYLKTIALERKGEIWERELERANKAGWRRAEKE
jgi:prolyl-tRNA editing enzyme YbaK/EbsC (Cys-tRNA(Pro) deacylase)